MFPVQFIFLIRSNELVEDVKRVSEPYKKANRKFHPDDTVIEIEDLKLGGGYFQTIAGPHIHICK